MFLFYKHNFFPPDKQNGLIIFCGINKCAILCETVQFQEAIESSDSGLFNNCYILRKSIYMILQCLARINLATLLRLYRKQSLVSIISMQSVINDIAQLV